MRKTLRESEKVSGGKEEREEKRLRKREWWEEWGRRE